MKIYLAGKVRSESERKFLEEIDELCKGLGFETFLPHRDVGLCSGMEDVGRIFEGDVKKGFKGVDIVVAVLDGLHVGAGTAWEMGYAQAIGKKVIGLKTDRKVEESLGDISVIIAGQVDIVGGMEELREKLKQLN